MFASWAYGLIFFAIVAINHKYGKPWSEARQQNHQHARARKTRYETHRQAEKKEFRERRAKRRQAKREEELEGQRLEG
ncbi:hypothetical protein B0A50_05668, partial [Salinomyces thailandicus]